MFDTLKRKEYIAPLALFMFSIISGISYSFTKEVLVHLKPYTALTFRFGFSTILLSIIYIQKLKLLNTEYIKNGSIIGSALMLSFITSSVGLTFSTASKQSFIVASNVLIVPMLVWAIYHKKPDKKTIISVFLSIFGIGLLTIEKNMAFNIGDILSILCAFFCALQIILIEIYGSKLDPILLTIVQFAFSSVCFVVLAIIFEGFDITGISNVIFPLTFLVVVGTVITYCLLNAYQRFVSATTTSLILVTEAVFGFLFAVAYLGEKVSLRMVIGCIIIFVAIIIQQTGLKFKKN